MPGPVKKSCLLNSKLCMGSNHFPTLQHLMHLLYICLKLLFYAQKGQFMLLPGLRTRR